MYVYTEAIVFSLAIVLTSGSEIHAGKELLLRPRVISHFHVALRKKREAVVANNQNQQQSANFSNWGPWSRCSITRCGLFGVQRRQRPCNGNRTHGICLEAVAQTRRCSRQCEAAGPEFPFSWNAWTKWSSCSVSCGQGLQLRNRRCQHRNTSSCSNFMREERLCRAARSCPGWSNWLSWSSCSTACGNGTKQRTRECIVRSLTLVHNSSEDINILRIFASTAQLDLPLEIVDVSECHGGQQVAQEVQSCSQTSSCNLGHWSAWQQWTSCSKTCGMGYTNRSRNCIVDPGLKKKCHGSSYEVRQCYSLPCWSPWSSYSKCSASCGGQIGYRIRTRQCLGISHNIPSFSRCRGLRVHYEACAAQEQCTSWGPWGKFSSCSKSCNAGVKTRTRKCLTLPCYGSSIQRQSCNFQQCPYWSTWTSFSCCSATCGEGNGLKTRTRKCNFGYPGVKGCPGNATHAVLCKTSACNGSRSNGVFSDSKCGTRNHRNSTQPNKILKIIGGMLSERRDWPWHGSWQHYDCVNECSWKHLCGSTLIASQWAITAAHCTEGTVLNRYILVLRSFQLVHDNPGETWSVVIGVNRLYEDGARYHLSQVYVHPNYSLNYITKADVALVKLRWPAPRTPQTTPICMPNVLEQPKPGESCYITGWDGRAGQEKMGLKLLEARIPILAFEQCRELGSNYAIFLRQEHHLCAGDPVTAHTDTCRGDSGGPLACQRSDLSWYLAGVTSFGFECGKPGHVGVYAPVSSYGAWIQDVVTRSVEENC